MTQTSDSDTEQKREREIQRVTLWGSIVNFFLLIFKFAAGILGGSAAMLADAVHSLSDFLTDIVVVVFVHISNKPSDEGHEFGHGKYETLATAIIGIMLAGVGLGILENGAKHIWAFLHGQPLDSPGWIALAAAILSVVLKEILYQVTAARGKALHSQAMVANAWHHRSDALSSIGTAIGIGGAILLGDDWRVLDPLAAVVVSVFILKVAFQLFVPSMGELLEKSLPEEDERFIIDTILSQPSVCQPHNLRTRRIGNYAAIDVHIRMAPDTTIAKAHEATRQIEDLLRAKFGGRTIITTHMEPLKEEGK